MAPVSMHSPRVSRALLASALLSLCGCGYVIPAVIGSLIATRDDSTGDRTVLLNPAADLLLSRGPLDSGNTTEGRGQTVVALQARLVVSAATTLNSVKVRAAGTGDDRDLRRVRLYVDADSNGLLDAGDPELGAEQLFVDDDGEIVFANLEQQLEPGTFTDLLVVYDTPQTAAEGATFVISLPDEESLKGTVLTDPATGRVEQVQLAGVPLVGGVKTISTKGTLTLLPGSGTPPSRAVPPQATDLSILQLELRNSSVEPVRATRLVLTTSGSADDLNDVGRVDLYRDVDADGALTAGVDLPLVLAARPDADNGQIVFAGIQRDLAASATERWLVLYTLNGNAADGSTLRVDLQSSDLSVTGLDSNLEITPGGGSLTAGATLTVQRATVDFSPGAFNGQPRNVVPGQTLVSVAQFVVGTGPAEPVNVQSLRIDSTGTGDESVDLSAVRLFVDSDGDGSPVGEQQLAGTLTYAADNGSVVFNGINRTIVAGSSETWLVTYDISAASGGGIDFRALLAGSSSIQASGTLSGLNVIPGVTVTSGGLVQVTGQLSLTGGPLTPAAGTPFANDPNVAVLQLRLIAGNAESVSVTQLSVTPAGTSDDQAEISRVDLVLDQNNDGVFAPPDVVLASTTYPADDTALSFTNPAGLIAGGIPAGASRDLLVVYQFSGAGLFGNTVSARVQPADVTANGLLSGQPITTLGSAANGNTFTLQRGRLAVTAGSDNPGAADVLNGQVDAPFLQLNVEAGPSESVSVERVVVRASGTAQDATDVAGVKLYLEGSGPTGVFDATDTLLDGPLNYSGDDGQVTFTGAPLYLQPAGSTAQLLVTYDISGTAGTPLTLAARFDGGAEVSGTGFTSTLSAETVGPLVQGGTQTIRRGSLTVSAGTNHPTAAPPPDVFPNATGLVVSQIRLQAGFPEAIQINQLTLDQRGSVDEGTAVTQLSLVLDQNGDGIVGAGDTTLRSTPVVLDDETIAFSFAALELVIPAAEARNLLVVYDLAGVALPPQTLQVDLSGPAQVQTLGLISGLPVPPGGTPVIGNPVTLQLGALAVSTVGTNPGASSELRLANDVEMLQLRVASNAVESVNLQQLTVQHSGSGNPQSGLSETRLFLDQNQNGVLDADTLVASATFDATGRATFDLTALGGRDIAASDAQFFLVTHTFTANPTPGDTFQVSLVANGDVSGVGNASALGVPISGAPQAGGVKTIATASLGIAAGADLPAARDVFRDEADVETLQLTFTAGAAEAVAITSMTLTATGGGDPVADVAQVRLYLEQDPADGVLNGDQLVASAPNFGAGGVLTLTPLSAVEVPAGGSKSLLVVIDYGATAGSAGLTLGASLGTNADVTARGVVTGLPVAPTGLPPAVSVTHTVAEASLTLALGPNPPPDRGAFLTEGDVEATHVAFSAGPAEPVRISRLVFTASGTGDANTGIVNARLFRDLTQNGVLDGDALVAQGTFVGGVLTLDPLAGDLDVPAGGTISGLLVLDFGGTAADTQTFRASLNANADVTASGILSSLPVPPTGAPVTGAEVTTAEVVLAPTIAVALPAVDVFADATDVPALSLRLSTGPLEGVRVTSVTVRAVGSANDTGVVARLYRDLGGDGVLDATDPFLVSQTFTGDGGPITFLLAPLVTIPASASADLLVVLDLPNTASDGQGTTLELSSAADVVATGATTGGPVMITGGPYPVSGATVTVRETSLLLSAPNPPPAATHLPSAVNVPVVSLRLAAGAVEGARVTSVSVRPGAGSTGDHTQATARLVRDVNSNGTYEPAIDLVLRGPQPGTNGTQTFTNALGLVDIPASGLVDLLVAYDFNGAPAVGDVFDLALLSTDVVAQGLSTLNAITPGGGPVAGPAQSIALGTLAVAVGAASPVPGVAFTNEADVEVLQLTLTAGPAEAVRVTGIDLTATGDLNDLTGLVQVELFLDVNGNGVLEAEPSLGNATAYPSDQGTFVVTVTPGALDLAPGASASVLLVYDLGGTAAAGQAFGAGLTAGTNVRATGLGSLLSITPSGGALSSALQTVVSPTLSVAAGAGNVSATAFTNSTDAETLSLRFSAGAAEAVRVSSLTATVTAAGGGDSATAITAARLFCDVDADGVLSAGDQLLGSGNVSGGTVVFTPGAGTCDVPAAGSSDFLLTFNFGGTAAAAQSFQGRLVNPAVDVSAVGVSSGLTLNPSGGAVNGGTVSLLAASLTAAAGPNNPASRTVSATLANAEVLQLRLSAGPAEPVRVASLRVTPAGLGNDLTGLVGLRLYRDANQNGVLDGDPLLASPGNYPADNTAVVFTRVGGLADVPPGGSVDLLLVYDLGGSAAPGQDFRGDVVDAGVDVVASGLASGLGVTPTGSATGATLTVLADPQVVVTQQAAPPPATVVPDAMRVPVLQLRLSETTGLDAARLTSLHVRGLSVGSGDESLDVALVRLFRDLAPFNGVLGPEDVPIGLGAYFNDGGLVTFGGLSETVPASGTLDLLLSYDFADATSLTTGETFQARVEVGGIGLQGVTSGNPVVPSGLPQTGSLFTAQGPQLTVAVGPNPPPAAAFAPADSQVPALQLALGVLSGPLTVESLTLTASGSGTASAVSRLWLLEDVDGDGLPSSGDVVLRSVNAPFGGGASATLSGLGASLANDTEWLVLLDFDGTPTAGDGFAIAATAATATAPASVLGLPVAGPTLTANATLEVSLAPANPTGGRLAAPSTRGPLLLLRLEAQGAPLTLARLDLSGRGDADDSTDLTGVELFLDDGDGVFEPAADDVLLSGPVVFGADDGTVSFTALGQALALGTPVDLWASIDVAGAAPGGSSVRLVLDQASDVDVGVGTLIRGLAAIGAEHTLGAPAAPLSAPTAVALGAATPVLELVEADVDGDGDRDVVVLRGDGLLQVLSNAAGTLTPGVAFPGVALTAPRRLAAGDLNGDGVVDLLVSTATTLEVFLGLGAGAFAAPTSVAGVGLALGELGLVDYDGDGDLDAVVLELNAGSPALTGRRGDGAGGFSGGDSLSLPAVPVGLALGDVDRDGRCDVLLGTLGSVRVAAGNGTFFALADSDAAGAVVEALVSVDLDRDGFPDVLAGSDTTTLRALLANGAGPSLSAEAPTYPSAPLPLLQTALSAIGAGDLDGDGRPDAVVLHDGVDGLVVQLAAPASPRLGAAGTVTAVAAGTDPNRLVLTDLDRDGDLDAVVASATDPGGSVSVLLGDGASGGGSSGFAAVRSVPLGEQTTAVALGDFNRDGRGDVVAVGSNLVSALQQATGPSAFQVGAASALNGAGTALATGDLNLDGRDDVVVAVQVAGADRLAVFLGNGAGGFSGATTVAASDGSPIAVALADFDQDGRLDAVSAEASGGLQLFRGNGSGLNDGLAGDRLVLPSAALALGVGDVDGDGDPDLVVALATSIEVRLNQGGFTFTSAAPSALAGGLGTPSDLAMGDADRDGSLDLFVASNDRAQVLAGSGTGTFSDQGLLGSPGDTLSAIALGDTDHDGDLDLLLARSAPTSALVVLPLTGPASFTYGAAVVRSLPSPPVGLVVGDLDRDGDPEAVLIDAQGLQVSIGH